MILTLNAGSSSLKFALYEAGAGDAAIAEGLFGRLGSDAGELTASWPGSASSGEPFSGDHAAAFRRLRDLLAERSLLRAIRGVGHRVVHGGGRFREPAVLDAAAEEAIAALEPLAPLHNPVNLACVRLAREVFAADVPHVAVFDTAFHATLPEVAYRYAVPARWYEGLGVRKYGFHGTSHRYVSAEAARLLEREGRPASRMVTLHLGNGCSAAAVLEGRSVDTTMGMTPLAGLVMGTRSGDVDPGLADYLAALGIGVAEQTRILNEGSGLYGIAGENDMRALLRRRAEADAAASLAVEVFVYSIRKTIGAYAAVLGGLDAVVFTAGIGENAVEIRRLVCRDFDWLGLTLDPVDNVVAHDGRARLIGRGACAVLVVPTDEEGALARAVAEAIAYAD